MRTIDARWYRISLYVLHQMQLHSHSLERFVLQSLIQVYATWASYLLCCDVPERCREAFDQGIRGLRVTRDTSWHCSKCLSTLQACMKSRDTARSFNMPRKVLLLTTQQVVTQPEGNTSQMIGLAECRSGIHPCTEWRVRGRQLQGIYVQWVQCMAGWSTSAPASYGQLSAC